MKNEITNNRIVGEVMLDLTVPGGTGGLKAISEIRDIDIKIPVYVASGYAEDPVMPDPGKYGFTGSICKPFTLKELAEIL